MGGSRSQSQKSTSVITDSYNRTISNVKNFSDVGNISINLADPSAADKLSVAESIVPARYIPFVLIGAAFFMAGIFFLRRK